MILLAKWMLSALALMLAAELVPGVEIETLYIALIVAVFLGFLNAIIRPILILLTLPINVLSLGLFIFVINGFLFWFLSTFIQGFSVDGFLSAIVGAFVVSVVSWVGNQFLRSSYEKDMTRRRDDHFRVHKITKPGDE